MEGVFECFPSDNCDTTSVFDIRVSLICHFHCCDVLHSTERYLERWNGWFLFFICSLLISSVSFYFLLFSFILSYIHLFFFLPILGIVFMFFFMFSFISFYLCLFSSTFLFNSLIFFLSFYIYIYSPMLQRLVAFQKPYDQVKVSLIGTK